MSFLATIRVDPIAISAIVVACAAAATLYGTIVRRRLDDQREDTRQRDRAFGWVDKRTGHRHVGAVDHVLGWTDDDGTHVKGDHQRLEEHLADRGGPHGGHE